MDISSIGGVVISLIRDQVKYKATGFEYLALIVFCMLLISDLGISSYCLFPIFWTCLLRFRNEIFFGENVGKYISYELSCSYY